MSNEQINERNYELEIRELLNRIPEKDQKIFISRDVSYLQYIVNQSNELCLYAVDKSPEAIKYINNIDEKLWKDIADVLANKVIERFNELKKE